MSDLSLNNKYIAEALSPEQRKKAQEILNKETGADKKIDADVVINTSSAGITGEFLEPKMVNIKESTTAYDLNYSINGTPFCKWAEAFTEKVHDGTGMLVQQAAKSFEFWFSFEVDVKKVLKEIEQFKNE